MFGGPLGAYEVNPTMVGGVNPTVQKIRPALSVKLVTTKLLKLWNSFLFWDHPNKCLQVQMARWISANMKYSQVRSCTCEMWKNTSTHAKIACTWVLILTYEASSVKYTLEHANLTGPCLWQGQSSQVQICIWSNFDALPKQKVVFCSCFNFFVQICWAAFVVGEPLCYLEPPLRALKT